MTVPFSGKDCSFFLHTVFEYQTPRTLISFHSPLDLGFPLTGVCPECNEYVVNEAGGAANILFSLSAQHGLLCQVLSSIQGLQGRGEGLSSCSGRVLAYTMKVANFPSLQEGLKGTREFQSDLN